ncbi:LOW QUALITY PROTEIN: protein SIEVE ELEMENT OCCLUSION B [Ziziphus jujuba]|uniref:LOW QUALITY PROTEIN: protein SIEVE ELEMENT OCCLUSION B n=1 Tax=Ziziphus jujuba TaxID=326968 RepID=A0ABM3IRC7_ZIZJJ|nr:LOW QUALITY PROTEIN: protein SIEVE ELEMENT OCCLUSION B [Ziziphus jujuba]
MFSTALGVVGQVTSTVTTSAQHLIDGEPIDQHLIDGKPINLFTMSDSNVLEHISATHTHSHPDNSLDVDSLFYTVQNIIKRSAQIVDSTVQGTQVHVETIEEKPPKSNFSSPLCTLRTIGCEPPGEEIALKSTLSILNNLSDYSWDAKAVLTLAAFALEYGEFWHLVQLQQSDQLAKSLAILKRVPIITLNPANLQKRRHAIVELNGLIKTTLQVVENIFELQDLSTRYFKDVAGLATALQEIPVDVFWVIISIVACATKITILTSDEDKHHDLTPYAEKIHHIFSKLKIQLVKCKKQIEELHNFTRLCILFRSCTAILPILKALVFPKDDLQPIIDGSTKTTVAIDILRRKNVLLFISRLDISEEDINILKPIHEGIKNNNLYNIVWIPIVEQWTEELKKKFEILRSKMPWYVVQYFSPIAGLRFIKQEWNFKGKPIVVVLNVHGRPINLNALDAIRIYGMKAFPFDTITIDGITVHPNWIEPIVNNIDPTIPIWIKEEKYIFFYGGKDNDWIQQFRKSAQTVVDPVLKDAKINIELFGVGKGSKGGEDLGIIERFWKGIDSLFFTQIHHQHVDSVSKEVQKLLSYKNESGWALLSKGSKVVVTGHGFTILRVVDEFEKWKGQIKEKAFETAFKEYHNNVLSIIRHCSRLDIPNDAGKVPETMPCPECHRVMKTYTSYKCCHVDDPLEAHH